MEVGTSRNYLFDNIKLLLIFLVVLVHLFAAVNEIAGTSKVIQLFMIMSCSFHMPLFMFISGYFSKLERAKKDALNVLIMYMIAQIILCIFNYFLTGQCSIYDLIFPGFSMWYLFALFFLRYMLPEMLKINHILILSAAVSIFIMGVETSGSLEKSVIKFFANAFYFLLGYYAKKEYMSKLYIGKYSKCIGIFMFIIGTISVYLILSYDIISPSLLRIMMLRSTYVQKAGYGIWGYLIYVYILFMALWMSLSVILICPRKKLPISFLGQNTNTIYIGQALLYLGFRAMLKTGMIQGSFLHLIVIAFVLSIACVIFFGNFIFSRGLRNMIALIRNKVVA